MPFIKSTLLLLLSAAAMSGFTSLRAQPKEVTFNGNYFTLKPDTIKDTTIVTDPVSGNEKMAVTDGLAGPAVMNGERIYESNEVTTPAQNKIPGGTLGAYIVTALKNDDKLKELGDCSFRITLNNIITDKHGNVVYYDDQNYNRIRYYGEENVLRFLNEELNKILANAPQMQPATLNGKQVIAYLNFNISGYEIEVKNHIVSFTK